MLDENPSSYKKISRGHNLNSLEAGLRRNQCLILASESFRPLDMGRVSEFPLTPVLSQALTDL